MTELTNYRSQQTKLFLRRVVRIASVVGLLFLSCPQAGISGGNTVLTLI